MSHAFQQWFKKSNSHLFLNLFYGFIALIAVGWLWSLLYDLFTQNTKLPLPWQTLTLLLHFNQNTSKENILLLFSVFIPLVVLIIAISNHFKAKHIRKIFGDAHWATLSEIKKMGLTQNKNGLIIGKKNHYLLRAPLISHALIFAPSRSGKGVSQVIPNALTFPDSILFIDVKDEIFEATSGFRQQHGQHVFSFAPGRLNKKTHRWNPLDLIDKNSSRLITDIDIICETLVRKTNSGESNMWIDEARTLFKGLLLWLMNSGRPFHLGELINFLKGTPNFIEELTAIRDNAINSDGTVNIHPIAFTNINNFIEKAFKEQSGVKSTLTSYLNLWDDPYIQAATETSDFNIRDMRKKRMTIYLGVPIDQIDRLAPLMNLFIQLFLSCMLRQLPSIDEPHKILVVLDEFCALGRMDILKNGFGFLAGFNVHLMAIIQNVGQFYDTYGGRDRSDVFFQNTDYKIAYRQNAKTDREFVSDLCGATTIKNRTTNFSHSVTQKPSGGSESHMSKPLISADQVGNFSSDLGIAKFNGQPPIKYQRIIYYNDERFKNRLKPPIDLPVIEPNQTALNVHLKKTTTFSESSKKSESINTLEKILPALSTEIHSLALKRLQDETTNTTITSEQYDEDDFEIE